MCPCVPLLQLTSVCENSGSNATSEKLHQLQQEGQQEGHGQLQQDGAQKHPQRVHKHPGNDRMRPVEGALHYQCRRIKTQLDPRILSVLNTKPVWVTRVLRDVAMQEADGEGDVAPHGPPEGELEQRVGSHLRGTVGKDHRKRNFHSDASKRDEGSLHRVWHDMTT